MADGYADETRDALLAKAREAWRDDPALDAQALGDGSGGDSVSCYLRAYYQRVATEDLAPPSRLATVAEAHARLGLRRPQGRALVQVREPDDAHLNPVSRSGLVVDIVTDDMPYLVDSVTTELNRHEAEILLIVHPLLRVRRDVTGALRGILGVCGDDADPAATTDEQTESWIHVELGPPRDRVTADQLAAALRHVLDDVRVAAEDQQRMGLVARRLADDLGGEPGSDQAEYGDLLRWLADGNFTFLGYREYDLVRTEEGTGLRPVPGTGLGILRHERQGRASLRKMSTQVVRRAQDPAERLVLAKANSRSTVYRANYLDYVSVKKLGPDGVVAGEFRFLGLYSHAAHTAPIATVPVIRRKVAQVLAEAGLAAGSHDGKDLAEILEDYPREELFEISAEELIPIALGVLRLSERKHMLADDHAAINLPARLDHHRAAVFQVPHGVSHGLALIGRDQHPVAPANDVAAMRTVGVKQPVHHRSAAGVGEEFALIADQSARRRIEDEPHPAAAGRPHLDHLALALGEFLHHHAGMLFVDVDHDFFDRFEPFAGCPKLEQHLRPRYRKLKTFAAHRLDQNAQLKLAAAGDLH